MKRLMAVGEALAAAGMGDSERNAFAVGGAMVELGKDAAAAKAYLMVVSCSRLTYAAHQAIPLCAWNAVCGIWSYRRVQQELHKLWQQQEQLKEELAAWLRLVAEENEAWDAARSNGV
ncbi:unnamed protein product [Closterium sp. NIES-64]|nr:unnamed protein product [Closterium sp. NIES-64]